jgi:uncharacterized protein
MRSTTLYQVLASSLVLMASALVWSHFSAESTVGHDPRAAGDRRAAGRLRDRRGRAVMGVAGGELLIRTIVLLYAVDSKLAGSRLLVTHDARRVHSLQQG